MPDTPTAPNQRSFSLDSPEAFALLRATPPSMLPRVPRPWGPTPVPGGAAIWMEPR